MFIAPQTNNSQISFKGHFKSNELFQRSLLYATPKDLFELSQAFKRMKKARDHRKFWLTENLDKNNYSIRVKTHAILLNCKEYDKTRTYTVGQESVLYEMPYTTACFKDLVANINKYLSKIYPSKR